MERIVPGPLEQIILPLAVDAGVRLYCKRDDQYTPAPHTALQGNKVRKLAPFIKAALAADQPPLLVSFGGAYSNHLSALATAGQLYRFPVTIFVRGEEVDNPLLRQAQREGATLIRLSRSAYRLKHEEGWLANQRMMLAEARGIPEAQIWFIPEGGTCTAAVNSVKSLSAEIERQLGEIPDYICLSAGTGGTAAGVILGAAPTTKVEVYPALKGDWMTEEIRRWLPVTHSVSWDCITKYHFKGYGKFPQEWLVPGPGLAKRAYLGPGLPPLEPIYTAKLFSGVMDRIARGEYPRGSTIVIIHTGGIY